MEDGVYRVVSGAICAGYVVEGGRVVSCAPVLRRRIDYWMTKGVRVDMVAREPDVVESRDVCRVLWFDPGGTTGWAAARLQKGRKVLECVRETMKVGQIKVGLGEPDESAGAWAMMELIAAINDDDDVLGPLDVVGVEDFRLFPGETHSPDQKGTTPMRIIAKVDMLFWMAEHDEAGSVRMDVLDPPRLVKQMPGERSIITDKRLKDWGLWRTEKRQGGGQHAMDALRHLIVFGRKGSW